MCILGRERDGERRDDPMIIDQRNVLRLVLVRDDVSTGGSFARTCPAQMKSKTLTLRNPLLAKTADHQCCNYNFVEPLVHTGLGSLVDNPQRHFEVCLRRPEGPAALYFVRRNPF